MHHSLLAESVGRELYDSPVVLHQSRDADIGHREEGRPVEESDFDQRLLLRPAVERAEAGSERRGRDIDGADKSSCCASAKPPRRPPNI